MVVAQVEREVDVPLSVEVEVEGSLGDRVKTSSCFE
jgi:hypothetical protein